MTRLLLSRLGWTLWALVPVALLAYHFGPGQAADREDRALRAVEEARRLEVDAQRLQEVAYERHLAAIAARAAAFGRSEPDLRAAAVVAGEVEDAAAKDAAAAWAKVASSLAAAESLLDGSAGGTSGGSSGGSSAEAAGSATTPLVDASSLREVRLARGRALVRAGEVAAGANLLEDLLIDLDDHDAGGSPLALAAREELATAYYYGARLLRLAGAPAEEWRRVAVLARQNFRYLAEDLDARGGGEERVRDLERNTELVLNLEQSSLEELQARARPRESPTGACRGLGREPRPGNRGRRSGDQPNKGAGMGGEIGQGW